MLVSGTPIVMICSSAVSLAAVKKDCTFSEGALWLPCPSGPWHPAQLLAYRLSPIAIDSAVISIVLSGSGIAPTGIESQFMIKATTAAISSSLRLLSHPTIKVPAIEHIAEREWEIHLKNMALENIEPLFSGKAVEVFKLSLTGMSVEEIASKLELKENSVYRLKNRVKERLIQEIIHLREELE